jgi:hypothetical protein
MIEVESSYALADVGKPECERKPYVTAADNPDLDALIRKKLRFPIHINSSCANLSAADSKNALKSNSNDIKSRKAHKGPAAEGLASTPGTPLSAKISGRALRVPQGLIGSQSSLRFADN